MENGSVKRHLIKQTLQRIWESMSLLRHSKLEKPFKKLSDLVTLLVK